MSTSVFAALVALAAPSPAPVTLLYDYAAELATVVSSTPTRNSLALGPDHLVQQGPARGVLKPDRMAAKVSSRVGSPESPSVRGLDGAALAALLRREIDDSSAHLVFVDEASGTAFQGAGGRALATAMATLASSPHPDGGTYASRVHAYVYDTALMIGDERARSATWSALARMGGVWLETFTSANPATPWTAHVWRTRPRAFSTVFARRGGDLRRLHFLMPPAAPGDQPRLWRLARSGRGPGSACAILLNGVGAYRVSAVPGSLAAWVREYRRVFPLLPGGARTLTCVGER